MCVLSQGSERFSATSNQLRARIAQLESALRAHQQAEVPAYDHSQRRATLQRHTSGQRARQIGGRDVPVSEASIHAIDVLITEAVGTLQEAEGMLQAYQKQIQQLGERMIDSLEAERHHLARELHDEFGQVLTGLNLTLSVAERLPTDLLHRQLADARSQVSGLIAQVRQRSLQLRPVMLDEFGLRAALEWLITRYREQTGIVVDTQLDGLEQRFAPLYELAAYRIIQEAITNIARHASVSHATLHTWVDCAHIKIVVQDRGRGFDTATTQSAYESSGLVGMWERAVMLGGDLTIESAPGKGTRLQAYLPLVLPA